MPRPSWMEATLASSHSSFEIANVECGKVSVAWPLNRNGYSSRIEVMNDGLGQTNILYSLNVVQVQHCPTENSAGLLVSSKWFIALVRWFIHQSCFLPAQLLAGPGQ